MLAAIVGGIVGTIVMTMVMVMAPRMGMPEMDVPGMLGSMFGAPNRTLGLGMHLMMGAIFGILYYLLGALGAGIGTALLYGTIHWLIAGAAMGMVPMMHAGIKSGKVAAPGLYMTAKGGMMSFVGGLVGHLVFAASVWFIASLF